MRFDLNEDQLAFRETVGRYLTDECPVQKVVAAFDADAATLMGPWRGLMELGIGGLVVPEEYGGSGLELLDLAVVAEIVGRHAMPGPFFEHAVATYAILLGGSKTQKEKWLPGLATGEIRATIAFAEAPDLWLDTEWAMPATTPLNGEKQFVVFAEDADLIVVGLAGGRFAVAERGAANIEIRALHGLDGGRRLSHVTFKGTPAELLDGGADVGARVRDVGLVLLAADAWGGASWCVDQATAYAKERVQFGVPIGQFQGVKHQIADIAVDIFPAQGLYWYAAFAFDHEPDRAPLMAAMCKAHITESYVTIARRTVELHGGIGYTWEFGVHGWLKRAVFNRTYLGMPARHRARVATLSGW